MTETLAPASTWVDDAACLAHFATFFPQQENDADTERAKRICQVCPVRQACLNAAMAEEKSAETVVRAGVRGGLTPAERASASRRARRKATR